MEGDNSDPPAVDASAPIEASGPIEASAPIEVSGSDHEVDHGAADAAAPSTADDTETSAPASRPSQQSGILDMVAALFVRRESVASTASAAAPYGGAEASEASPLPPASEADAETADLAAVGDGGELEGGVTIPVTSTEEQQVSETTQRASTSGGMLSAVASLFRSRQSADGVESPAQENDNSATSSMPVGLEEQEISPSDSYDAQGHPEGEPDRGDTAVLADSNEAMVSGTQNDLVVEPKSVDSRSSAAESTGVLAAIASMFRRRSSVHDYEGIPPETSQPESPELTPAKAFESSPSPDAAETTPIRNPSPSQDNGAVDNSSSSGPSQATRQSMNPQSANVSGEIDGLQSTPQPQRRATANITEVGIKSDALSLNGENDLDEDELLQIALQISIEEGSHSKSQQPAVGPLSPGKLDKTRSSRRTSFKTTFTSKDAHEGWAIEENAPNKVPNGADPSSEPLLSIPAAHEPSERLTRSQKYEKAMRKLEESPGLVDEIRFARRYRRASLVPEQDLDLYPAAEPDCGKVGKKPHLSRSHAIETTEQFRMGFYEEGQRKPFPLSCSFGWHRWPFSTYEQTDNGVLVDYGLGVSLYFKLVKALIMLFFFMNICTLPAMLMYILGDSIQPVQRQYYKDTNNQNILGTTTMASLGQPFPVCQRVGENQTFQFSCPGAAKIQSIVAYYGQPQGSCTCPGIQQPDSQGNCRGTVSGTVQNALSNQLNYKGQQCVADASGFVAPCFLGSTRFGVDCCTSTLDSNGNADLSALSLSANLQCNSFTAQYIAESVCLNQNSCSFIVEVS